MCMCVHVVATGEGLFLGKKSGRLGLKKIERRGGGGGSMDPEKYLSSFQELLHRKYTGFV